MIEPVISWEKGLALVKSGAVLADVRWYADGRSTLDAFVRGHAPGAVAVDLERDLSAPPSPSAGRHPLPEPTRFAEAMSKLGIGDDSVVVAYDDQMGSVAARLVWMLRSLGVEAALVDGGLRHCPARLEVGPGSTPSRASFSARPWPSDRLADLEEVACGVPVLIDARAPERYRGDFEPIDPRAGHIPGALNLPWASNLGPDGLLLEPEALRRLYEGVGAGDDADVVFYCGSGVTACFDLLAREAAGAGLGRLFPGSWSAWSSEPTRPTSLGSQP